MQDFLEMGSPERGARHLQNSPAQLEAIGGWKSVAETER